MKMKFALLILVTTAPSALAQTPDYPFVGKWDCEVATFTFTNTTYNNGSETLRMTKVEKKGRTKDELDAVIRWLTGYDQSELDEHLAAVAAGRLSRPGGRHPVEGPASRNPLRTMGRRCTFRRVRWCRRRRGAGSPSPFRGRPAWSRR